MADDVQLRCSCGKFAGMLHGVSADNGTRGICYCRDCQAFAHFLQRAPEILDSHGGTDIYQTSPARLEFTRGHSQLACVSLTPRLLRWYTHCCRTPIGNTLPTPKIPFVGIIHSCLALPDRLDADGILGPPRFRVHARHARGDVSGLGAHPGAPLSVFWRFGRMLLAARLRGDHKRSPLFAADTGLPIAEPEVLSREALAEIRRTVSSG